MSDDKKTARSNDHEKGTVIPPKGTLYISGMQPGQYIDLPDITDMTIMIIDKNPYTRRR
ncbi:hypothetical protein [Musicola paradisiaca]|uniref:Uncharacterized protein n=1 Tax=Musicola paradisiaca (strain Ech703) TaxID=579405 RepID=C6C677_MUSP7|nr:hypothetical protein [Musicola paradisiaca]ACS87686.1 hypothetical protein Dd703_3933 [Musicola paradisiaca Ech703]